MSFSIVITTKNEEKNIGRTLKSIEGLSDDIIVMDSKSTDQTVEICQSFPNVSVHTTEWEGFGPTKNKGNRLAKHSYILSLDADEPVSPELRQELEDIKKSGQLSKNDRVYSIPRLTNYCGKWVYHCGWRPDRQLRLFPKDHAQWSANEVHEKLTFSDSIKVVPLKSDILHYSYHSVSDHIDRINKYSTLGAQQLIKKKKTSFLLAKGVINGALRFFKQYVLKGGFLDGYAGFYICSITGFMVFLKYLKAFKLKNKEE